MQHKITCIENIKESLREREKKEILEITWLLGMEVPTIQDSALGKPYLEFHGISTMKKIMHPRLINHRLQRRQFFYSK